MNGIGEWRCRELLDRLYGQLDHQLPKVEQGRATEAVQLDRLPALAELVRTYIEAEAVLAQVNPPPDDA